MNNKNILLINKPKHWTSNDVIRKFKKVTKIKKVGHSGTLDPLASGLLILGYNNGTKELNTIITNDKKYIATIHFNYKTETLDSEGIIINYSNKKIELNSIINSLDNFLKIDYYQEPPKYSAIKINGYKAYDLARRNISFEIPKKLVKLYDYKIISYIDKELIIELHVSKGFYIRSFCRDLANSLDTYGNLANLIRTNIGEYQLIDAINIEEINEDWIKHK